MFTTDWLGAHSPTTDTLPGWPGSAHGSPHLGGLETSMSSTRSSGPAGFLPDRHPWSDHFMQDWVSYEILRGNIPYVISFISFDNGAALSIPSYTTQNLFTQGYIIQPYSIEMDDKRIAFLSRFTYWSMEYSEKDIMSLLCCWCRSRIKHLSIINK